MSKLTESLFPNKELRRELEEIDESCPNEISHGYQHAINVIENIKKLAKLLEIDETTTDYLIIAGYLHDLGQKEGKKATSPIIIEAKAITIVPIPILISA